MALNFKKLRPLLNRIVIQKPEATKVSKGGIILKDTTQASWGTVVAVGPGRITEKGDVRPVAVEIGDNVLLPEYGGMEIKMGKDKQKLFVYRDDEVIGILEEKISE